MDSQRSVLLPPSHYHYTATVRMIPGSSNDKPRKAKPTHFLSRPAATATTKHHHARRKLTKILKKKITYKNSNHRASSPNPVGLGSIFSTLQHPVETPLLIRQYLRHVKNTDMSIARERPASRSHISRLRINDCITLSFPRQTAQTYVS